MASVGVRAWLGSAAGRLSAGIVKTALLRHQQQLRSHPHEDAKTSPEVKPEPGKALQDLVDLASSPAIIFWYCLSPGSQFLFLEYRFPLSPA